MDTKLLIKRFDELKVARKNWDQDYEDIALYTMPGKADFITQRSAGDPARRKLIHDSTAIVANHTLASHMHMAMTSPSTQWFSLAYTDAGMGEADGAKEVTEKRAHRMFTAIGRSNFVSAINEHYQDLIGFGSAVLLVSFKNDPMRGFRLVFDAVPLNEVMFMENDIGEVDTVFREKKYTARQAVAKFGEGILANEKIKKVHAESPDRELSFVNAIYPNLQPKLGINKKFPFWSKWIFKNDQTVVSEEGYYEMPYMIPRWSKMSTEQMGYGPGLMALPEVRTLNRAKRLELRSWEKAIDPPLTAMATAVLGDIHLEAGGMTNVRDHRALNVLHDQANWQAVMLKGEDSRKQINSIYLIDQLILPERPNATATEVHIRYEMMQRVLGPTMGRIQSELLNPMVRRIYGMMDRAGQFDDIPATIESGVKIEYTGPLAKAQRAGDAQGIERLLQYLLAVAQIDPTVMDIMDMQKAAIIQADRYGAPAEVIRTLSELKKMKAQRDAAQQKQAEAENAMTDATIAGAQESEAGSNIALEALLSGQ